MTVRLARNQVPERRRNSTGIGKGVSYLFNHITPFIANVSIDYNYIPSRNLAYLFLVYLLPSFLSLASIGIGVGIVNGNPGLLRLNGHYVA